MKRFFRLLLLTTTLLIISTFITNNITTQAQSSLTVQIRNNGAETNQSTPFAFLIKNTGTSAVSGLSVRVYYTVDGTNGGSGYVLEKYWDQSGLATVSAPTLASGSIYYITVNYGTASLAAGGQWEFQTALHLASWATTYDGTNDWYHTGYAFNALPAAYANTNNIPAYVNGTRVWGSEPGGAPAPTMPPTNAPTKTNTPNVPTNTPGGATAVPTVTRTFTPIPSATRTFTPAPSATPRPAGGHQMEKLNRGLIRVNQSTGNYISWRLLGTDPSNIAFNVYSGGTKLTASPITNSTNYFHSGGSSSATYTVRAVINGVEQADSEPSMNISSSGYWSIPLQKPAGGTTPDGVAYTYTANDASVGDLDGDGVYEIILKWDPTNSKDNSQSGYTGNVYIDAYKLNGTRMWRIDMGRNIRAGAHYTQFQVYDYDGDGKAEIAMKTGDGTISGTGQVIGNGSADYRNTSGYILSGPEYFSIFNGQTGAVMQTVNYDPPRGTVSSWGDSYGNRVDRFLAGTAYLDGQHPSIIMARGYYTRTVIVAWDWRNGQLTERWKFDSSVSGSQYEDQGNHQLSVADVDADDKDEIIYGSMAINDNGAPLWNTNKRHGDALHVGDFDPSHAGLELFKPDENTDQVAAWMADARTGAILWQNASCTCDNGRGVAGDIWAGSAGAEAWSSAVSGLFNPKGVNIGRKPSSTNFLIWWDADPVRELLDSTHIDKYGTASDTRLLTASGVHSNNGTKSTPSLSADLFGDWREEVIWPASDDLSLRIYFTTAVTSQRIVTLMHDSQYRVAIAWQNTAYNQPPHPSFFLGDGMSTPPQPNIYVVP